MNNQDQEQYQSQEWQEYRANAIKNNTVNVKEIDGVITISDPTNPINPELREWLERRGIDPNFYVEEEAKSLVLQALKDPLFERAYIDEDNGLVIESGDGTSPDEPFQY